MQDIIKSIKAYLYDRSSSPLLGAFICSWLVWNYKLIIIVFSSEELSGKFVFISEYWSEQLFWGASYFIFPSMLTALYIFAYPYIAKPVYEFSLKIQRELKKIKQQQENEMLLSVEESRQLRVEIASLREKYLENTVQLQRTITSQNEEIKKLKSQIGSSEISSEESKSKDKLSITKEGLVSLVNERERGQFSLDDLFGVREWSSFTEESKRILNSYLDELIEDGSLENVKQVKQSGTKKIYEKVHKEDFDLDDIDTQVIANISEMGEGAGLSAADLSSELGVSVSKVRIVLDKLNNQKYIEEIGYMDGATLYTATVKGLSLLERKGLLE
ncbi:hypothetical protein [Kangiella sp. M94]